ncbi:hypothetical protein ACFV4I_06205 [Nocardiopsis alba]|uniref:Uncharacterized protein n=1 Tax=Nocardiopsis alba TaxID=53437 RepID=A0A7K2ITC0_9ACTN|nr:hypothetical protein [Nocardiopsis sp. LDBS1602]MEC3893497.1 hypothetical protein [Nocardiopsis sp. LDBS1602]MYR33097.1 hypothetical protein [Nocardiopsis alba]
MNTRRPSEYDVEIGASLSADELTFHETSKVESRYGGEPGAEGTVSGDRSGLPRPVETGVVYEDVRVDYRLASRLRTPKEGIEEE